VGFEIALLMLIVYTLPGHWMFSTQAFASKVWWVLAAFAILFGLAEEGRKLMIRLWGRRRY
jgi:sodium/potassium-transporting ATPase subunit alpha